MAAVRLPRVGVAVVRFICVRRQDLSPKRCVQIPYFAILDDGPERVDSYKGHGR